jgi:hypothetical protein
MQDVVAALTGEGLNHWEVVKLLRLNPALLSKPPAALRGSIFFFTQYCGLRNAELFPFLQKNSAILGADMATLMPKKDYLYKSLGGTPAMLKRCPAFLSYDLETHIIPRAEFVRALNKGTACLYLVCISCPVFECIQFRIRPHSAFYFS